MSLLHRRELLGGRRVRLRAGPRQVSQILEKIVEVVFWEECNSRAIVDVPHSTGGGRSVHA